MAVQISVVPRNVELVQKGLDDLTEGALKLGRGRFYGRMVSAKKKITTYPPRFEGPYPWVSEKQRRYVLMAIKKGIITVPYRRTGTYGRKWKIIKIEGGYKLAGRAAQKGKDYTKYVGGSAYGTNQARIHQGRWKPVRDAVEEAVSGLPKEIARQVVLVARRQGYRVNG